MNNVTINNKIWALKLMEEANFSLLQAIAWELKIPQPIIDTWNDKMLRASEAFFEID